ncbi:MAG: hypothetical protein QM736_02125 [Vicinamibacterales bacterium]
MYRAVQIVDAGARKALKLHIEVPVEDMARLDRSPRRRWRTDDHDTPAVPPPGTARPSIWSAIHPRLLELIRAIRARSCS